VLDQMVDSYVAAFDQRDGELRWRTSREEMEGWARPLLYYSFGAAPGEGKSNGMPGWMKRGKGD
jgi:hypothetical protein